MTKMAHLVMNYEAEKTLLGALMLSPTLWDEVSGVLEVEDFSHPKHRIVWENMVEMGGSDYPSLMNHMMLGGTLQKVGDVSGLSELTDGLPVLDRVDNYVDILKEFRTRRELQLSGRRLWDLAQSVTDPGDLITEAEGVVYGLQRVRVGGVGLYTGKDLARLEEKDWAERSKGLRDGLPVGLGKVDVLLSPGIQKGDMVVVGARPSVGKTSFLCGVTMHLHQQGRKVLHIACEMGVHRNTWRMMGYKANIPLYRLRAPSRMSNEEKNTYANALMELHDSNNILLAYAPRPRPSQLQSIIRRAKAKMGAVDAVVLDYFQKVRPDSGRGSAYEERTSVAQDITAIAGEEQVPIIMGCQLGRAAETDSQSERPTKDELKGTGSLEEEATIVLLLHRWGIFKENPMEQGAEIIVAKQQDGPTGIVRAWYNKELTRWQMPEEYEVRP